MSKRPSETVPAVVNGKVARLDGAGVVKKTGPRLPVIIYKEGEPLHELTEYLTSDDGNPQSVEARIAPFSPCSSNSDIQVRIPGHLVTGNNRQVRSRQLWGSDVYTSDSDLVAVLMHCGYVYHTINQPVRDVAEVRAVVKPVPSKDIYISSPRNSIRSRAWSAPSHGCGYTVEKAWVLTRTGNSYDLSPTTDGAPVAVATFAPASLERMVTRSAVGPARQRHSQEITAVFNLVNEPWNKYTMTMVCDRGLKPHERTSARLHTHVMFLESQWTRYEVSKATDGKEGGEECYRFSKCKKALSSTALRETGVPMPDKEKEVLHDMLKWEELQWGQNSVIVRGEKYPLLRIHFMSMEGTLVPPTQQNGVQE